MDDLEYAKAWYSITPEERNQITTMRAQAAAAYPEGLPEGTSAFDVYTHQIAAGASAVNRDIPWAIKVVAYLIDKKDADDSTETNDLGDVVAKNDLYRKIQNQCARLYSTNDSLVACIRHVKKFTTGDQNHSAPLVTLFLAENGKLGAPPHISEASFFKRLEYIQGWPEQSTPYLVKGGLIGSDSGDIDEKSNCLEKVLKIRDRINAKTAVETAKHTTLAKALSALNNKTDCSIFAKQIDARTPLKTIPKAVESVVGDFDSEGNSMNAYGLIGLLTTDGYPVTTTDIYQRLHNALTQLDAALENKFQANYTSPSPFTLQGIIEELVKVPDTNS